MYHKIPLTRIKNSFSLNWNLTDSEINDLRIQYGLNNIVEETKNLWLELILDTFKDPMIWFLVGASILFAILKNYNQSVILLLATIPLIGMDAFLHWRTTASTRTLSKSLASIALVIRNNKEYRISATEIVPGDLVKITSNTYFPADGIIVGGKNIQADESALTGESLPAHKRVINQAPEYSDEISVHGSHWGFAGTRLLTGQAFMRVVFTGKETLYGEIVSSAIETTNERTPLQRSISKLIFNLLISASIICLILAIIRYSQGFGLADAILSAAILAVAALPDEFPVVFTFFLGLGVYRLALKKALVRRAVSVENIGRITCICSDKTGTITEGLFVLKDYYPDSNFNKETLLHIASLASRIDSHDPLDIAIFKAASSLKINFKNMTPVHTFPFTEDRQRETSILKQNNNRYLVASKGSPEVILSFTTMPKPKIEEWLAKASEFAKLGYKVIACAQCNIEETTNTEPNIYIEPASNYLFVGLLVFSDPPRKEVSNAVKKCLESGIHIIMITGDHPETARTIAKEIGLGYGNPRVILAENMNKGIPENYADTKTSLRNIDVIARAIPSQKLSIVKTLQSTGEIVAVTGDGVNDVPALKIADVGIGMGERGTQTTREVSDIILLDDNFNSIVNAIAEGRQLFKNLKMSFKYLFMIHIPFVLSAAIIPLLGFPLLYLPIHIVWIELLIHPTAMLVFQERTKNEAQLEQVQKTTRLHFFTKQEWFEIILTGIISTLFVILSYIFLLSENYSTEYARSFVLGTLGFMNVALIVGLSELKIMAQKIMSVFTIFFTALLIQLFFIAKILNLRPLHLKEWLIIITFNVIFMLILKIFKRLNIKEKSF